MNFRNMPAIITLSAGLIVCIIMIIKNVSLQTFLIGLFLVLLVFCIFSLILRKILIKLLDVTKTKEEEPKENDTQDEESEE